MTWGTAVHLCRRGRSVCRPIPILLAAVLAGGVTACASSAPPAAAPGPASGPATVSREKLSDTGRNPFFVLEPGFRQTYTGGDGRLVITVLDQTETVDGVATRVVEERESKGEALVELSRNFYAIDPSSQDVYYFGEDVDDYSHGAVEHPGTWRSGQGGAHYGLFMPGRPTVGFQHDQENAPGVAEDHAEVVSTTETVTGPSGPVANCIKVKETSRLEPGTIEYKLYAPGVGLVTDQDLTLDGYRR
jgi:hypothetical protein